jgi:hypothetical protein
MTSTAQPSTANANPNTFLASDLSIAWLLAAAAVLLQMLTNARYGYFRDELYFLACSDHLAWGYVDFAPLVPLLARVSRLALGDSLHAIRCRKSTTRFLSAAGRRFRSQMRGPASKFGTDAGFTFTRSRAVAVHVPHAVSHGAGLLAGRKTCIVRSNERRAR